MAFALREELASKRVGHDVWFHFWTQIGPCCTKEKSERALFHTRMDAANSSAMRHSLTFFELVEVDDSDAGDFDWNKPAEPAPKRRARR